jgi:hypothetical protein
MKRIIFTIDDKAIEQLEIMRDRIGAVSIGELLTKAAELAKAVAGQSDRGFTELTMTNPCTRETVTLKDCEFIRRPVLSSCSSWPSWFNCIGESDENNGNHTFNSP